MANNIVLDFKGESIPKSPLALRTVKKDANFVVVKVGLRKPAKATCGKCGKKIKEMIDCPGCGKTLCDACAGWTITSGKFVCGECARLLKEARNG
jgi:hypothetical protein